MGPIFVLDGRISSGDLKRGCFIAQDAAADTLSKNLMDVPERCDFSAKRALVAHW